MYAIVEFVADSSVAVVATNWLAKDSDNHSVCFWPPQSKGDKVLKERHAPAPGWDTFQVRVLHRYGITIYCKCCYSLACCYCILLAYFKACCF